MLDTYWAIYVQVYYSFKGVGTVVYHHLNDMEKEIDQNLRFTMVIYLIWMQPMTSGRC